ncbi:MAG TPA: DNA polymerase III subunit beta [Patescibacteria group bacterium]|nr:DNA polymerase III subunit beta [Patescibacteria group bacterium]
MKVSCTKENLSQALSLVGGITGKNINLPILNNVLIKVEPQKMELIATNLEVAAVVTVRAKIEEPGSFTIPTRTLAEYVNLLPNEKINLELQENELVVQCGKASTKIKGTSAEDFPVVPAAEGGQGYLLNAKELKEGLLQVLPAVAKSDIRPELAGVYMGFNVNGNNGTVTLAATDSYRLAEKRIPLLQGDAEHRTILPGRAAQELVRVLSVTSETEGETQVRFLVSENQIAVHYGNVELTSRLVEGQYPDYTQIIPKEFRTTAEVATDELTKEMKASGLFTTSGVNAVTLRFEPVSGKIEVTATSTQTGEYASEMEGAVKGEENTLVLNNRYVLDGLNNIGSAEATLKLINADSPCVLTAKGNTDYLYIVMPIRQ